MGQILAALAPLPVGVVLLWASRFKLLAKSAPETARRSALRALVGEDHVVGVYRAVGVGEFLLGALLVAPPVWAAEAVAATTLSAGLLGYLVHTRISAPESSCGCLGEKVTPVRARAFGRAGLMLVTSAVAVAAPGYWAGAFADRPVVAGAALVGWFAVAVGLSAELDGLWLTPLRRLRVRLRHPLRGVVDGTPLVSTLDRVYRSEAYRSVVAVLRSDVLESWDEGEWRIVTFAARSGDERATAVFAVPAAEDAPIRVVLVPETAEQAVAATADR